MAPGVRPGFQVSNECLPPCDVCLWLLSSQLRDVSAPARTSRRHLFSTQRKFPLMCCDAGAKEAGGASLFFYFLSFFFFFTAPEDEWAQIRDTSAANAVLNNERPPSERQRDRSDQRRARGFSPTRRLPAETAGCRSFGWSSN